MYDNRDVPAHLAGEKEGSLEPLFDHIIESVKGPDVDNDADFKLQLSNISWDNFVGRLSIGRVVQGTVKQGQLDFWTVLR